MFDSYRVLTLLALYLRVFGYGKGLGGYLPLALAWLVAMIWPIKRLPEKRSGSLLVCCSHAGRLVAGFAVSIGVIHLAAHIGPMQQQADGAFA